MHQLMSRYLYVTVEESLLCANYNLGIVLRIYRPELGVVNLVEMGGYVGTAPACYAAALWVRISQKYKMAT